MYNDAQNFIMYSPYIVQLQYSSHVISSLIKISYPCRVKKNLFSSFIFVKKNLEPDIEDINSSKLVFFHSLREED